jgi:hypothetical protein
MLANAQLSINQIFFDTPKMFNQIISKTKMCIQVFNIFYAIHQNFKIIPLFMFKMANGLIKDYRFMPCIHFQLSYYEG